ncbi:MAG: LacI family DNA-binding transcriptional regulator [Anaerolineae bacterium]
MARPTILDVARKAGVGVGTVSRVLNNSPRVSPATRQRVLNAIKELDFRPNTVARQLPRKTRLRNIGVITQPFINHHSFVERLRGVQRVLGQTARRYELVLYNISSLDHLDERLVTIARTGSVDGLLLIDLDLTPEQVELLTSANIPFVGLNQFQDRDWPCIGSDNEAGGRLAASYLIELGHRQIAYVGDEFVSQELAFTTSAERFAGFRAVMEEHGLSLPEDYVQLGPYGYDTARELTHRLLALPTPPTAIFAMSDMQALGCIAAVRAAGLRVPDDISVIGYDNLEISFHTGLTTINQNLELNGRLGIEYLLKMLSKGARPVPVPQMPPLEVVERQTTRPLHG